MADPASAPSTGHPARSDVAAPPPSPDTVGEGSPSDPLAEIGAVVEEFARNARQTAAQNASERAEVETFMAAFAAACQDQVRPAMQAVIQRLAQGGGGGAIEEHPGGEPRYRHPCIILWMSFQGEIVGEPRADREPYLQFEADVGSRDVQVSEGDMWLGTGGLYSGRTDKWQLSDLTRDRVISELAKIARRALPPLSSGSFKTEP